MTPDRPAYQQFDPDKNQWIKYSWGDAGKAVKAWQQTLATENLDPGDRVGIRRGNGFNWVLFDQAALSLGLVVVPLYVDDRADNVAYIIENSDIKLLYVQESEQWSCMHDNLSQLTKIMRVVIEEGEDTRTLSLEDNRVVALSDWLQTKKENPSFPDIDPSDLATIVYTSGTTGKPKGVMLTHSNLTSNSRAGVNHIGCFDTDRMISFLPLSHTFERTVGYYVKIMVGCEVVYARSINDLGEDLQNKKPTNLNSVPRIYERLNGKITEQ
jgi:long-chain acyl-CoA synthetase